jgi:uncharacterized protein (TIGR02118 family)
MVQRLVGSALKGVAVEKGLSGATLGSMPSFVAMGHLVFESVEAFQGSFGVHSLEIVGDLPNYTNCEPVIQVSEIMM